MSGHARIGRALLALCGHRSADVCGLSATEWTTLDELADEHRLRAYLHGRASRGELADVPEELTKTWQQAHRANAIVMLAQRRALMQAVDTLGEHGIDVVALKGAALAWTVWLNPAERIMRDIDLLVAEADGPRAYKILRQSGWDAPDLPQTALKTFAAVETHFPVLTSPEGVMCELHAHTWGPPSLPGKTMPRRDDTGLIQRAVRCEALGAALPSNEDMLAHLVVHAACSHLLNVGPQALVDIALWGKAKAVDWRTFWQRASRNGFDRPAALVFALVDRWQEPGFLARAECPIMVDEALLDEVELLLVQDLDVRKDVNVIASVARGRLDGRLEQNPLDRANADTTPTSRLTELVGRAASLGGSLLSPRTRRDGIATARLQRWMEG